ncbi:hypothetical protein ACIRH0_13080 [Streptomyces sp. NPDC093675]|uniref:hypothetical protein n=1 Tax=Streptomyces sp. NPDC093675 TaxID=3366049 RepID=UPI003821B11C
MRELKSALYESYLAAGAPTLDDIAADIADDGELEGAPSRDTIRRCLSSSDVPAQQADAAAVAIVLARRAAWNDEEFALLIRSLWIKARMAAPLGQPLDTFTDPFALEVHRAIDSSAGAFSEELPPLPEYVERDHDEELRQKVAQAVKGISTLAVLIGGSSTGKTRACWEAVHTLPEGWRLWHPIVPGRAEAALTGIGGIGPRTVVWLNDTQHYLNTPGTALGERVAAALRALMREPSQAPVLVLGTMWPEHWMELTQEPGTHHGPEDPHAQARYLLAGTGITVPSTFTGPDLEHLQAQGGKDPRLRHAALHAEQGQVTQYLAGAPALLERYRTAPAAAHAVIEAAMDARAAGHNIALPHALLEAAAESYLTDTEWDSLGEDWFEQALAYCAAPLRGARGPLTRIRPRRGAPSYRQPHYRLADFLEEHGHRDRLLSRAPTGFWEALVDHASRSDLIDLAQSAGERGLISPALRLFTAAFEAGQHNGLRAAGTILRSAGRTDEAIAWYQRANETGDSGSLGLAVTLLYDTGRVDQALAWLRVRAHAGDPSAPGWLAQLLRAAGRTDEALEWYRNAHEMGDASAHSLAVQMLHDAGRHEEAERWKG